MSEVRIGVVGTGFVSRHFCKTLVHHPGFRVSSVLTRRPVQASADHPEAPLLTGDRDQFLNACDIVLECSGDPIYATEMVSESFEAGRPVVTMNAEFHVTTGSFFVGKGSLTEAEGDQPGALASLDREARELGFQPLAYGNMKGFLNLDPTLEEMAFWSRKQGISLPMVTSFTDGTKVQIEQVLVGNGLGATIAQEGLLGPVTDVLDEASNLFGREAKELGLPIADYALSPAFPHGVFLVAEHLEGQRNALRYLKLGDGPFYTLVRPNIFVHLEIMKSVKRLWFEGQTTLDNSGAPRLSVAAVAKKDLPVGTSIPLAIGSFEFRGIAVKIADHPEHVPIGLIQNAVTARPLQRGQVVQSGDIEVPETMARRVWRQIQNP